MTKRIAVPLLFLFLGLGIGVAITLSVSTRHDDTGRSETLQGQPSQQTFSNSDLRREQASIGSTKSYPKDLTKVTSTGSTYHLHAEVASWIQTIEGEHVLDLLRQSTGSQWEVSPRIRAELQAVLLTKLVSENATAALDFAIARTDSVRSSLVQKIFHELALKDVDRAVRLARNLDLSFRKLAIHGIFEAQDTLTFSEQLNLAKRVNAEAYVSRFHLQKIRDGEMEDFRAAWSRAIALADTNQAHYDLLSEIAVSGISQAGIEVLGDVMTSMTHDEMRTVVSQEILVELAQSVPEEVFAFVLKMQTDDREFLTRRVVESWAEKDPHVALKAIEVVPPSQFRNDLLFTAALQWVHSNPREVLRKISELPAATREDAVIEATHLIAQKSPDEAATLLASIDDRYRFQAFNTLLETWVPQDLEAATEWVEGSDTIKIADRPMVLDQLASIAVWTHPAEAFSIAREIPISKDRSIGQEAWILRRIAHSDLDLAQALLSDVRSGRTETIAREGIAIALLDQGKPLEAFSLGSELPAQEHNRFTSSIVGHWMNVDLTSLLAQISEFPSAELRSNIVLQIHRHNGSRRVLEDSDLAELSSYLSEEDRGQLDELE